MNMRNWWLTLDYEMKKGGVLGVFRRIRSRLIGPSKSELLARIEKNSALEAERSTALIERLDATIRYVVDQAARDSEERIVRRLIKARVVSSSDPGSPSNAFDSVNAAEATTGSLGPLQTMDTALTESVECLRRELDAYARKQSFLIIDPASESVLVSDYGFDILVPASERGLLLHFLRKGFNQIENGVRQVILDHVKPGDTALDIGANVGLHSVLMARLVGSSGRLHAFEPHPLIAKALQQTMVMNGFTDHVTIQDKVVLDRSGDIDFWTGDHSPTSSVFADPQASQVSHRRQTISLDDYLPSGTRVDFVKMDAEGAEPLIIAGMQRILHENPAICLVLEISRDHFARSHLSMIEFYATMVRDGFQIDVVEDSGARRPVSDSQAFLQLENANIVLRRSKQPSMNA